MALSETKIKGLKELARRGDPGERDNARAILEKNGIKWDEEKSNFKAYNSTNGGFKNDSFSTKGSQTGRAHRGSNEPHVNKDSFSWAFSANMGDDFFRDFNFKMQDEAERLKKEYSNKRIAYQISSNNAEKYVWLYRMIVNRHYTTMEPPSICTARNYPNPENPLIGIKLVCTETEYKHIRMIFELHRDRFDTYFNDILRHMPTVF